jgi:hypothetical protein
MRLRSSLSCSCVASLALACGAGEGRDSQTSAASLTGVASITTSPGSDSDPGSTSATSTTSEGSGSTSGATASSASGGPKFDLGDGTGPVDPSASGGAVEGCQKIDFLFVVDNSGSMGDEQQNLVNSFNGFIDSIQNTVKAKDYHIMVIDTDAGSSFLQECFVVCTLLPECEGYPCNNLPMPEGCDASLGSGLTKNPQNEPCGIVGGMRYMVDGQPNLAETFSCLGKVGINGDGSERPMEAMVTGITALNKPGACNDGFLRKDALLVVTFITDEEDIDKSNGGPAGWKASLVASKVGVETSIVVLGLIGDTDQPNALCTADQAEASPRLREFAESFTFGSWGPVCSPDYAPFFDAAVSVIDTACQQFEPPG